MFLSKWFKSNNKSILPKSFNNEDPSVIMHLVGKEIVDLQKYLDSCNSKDLGRKYIIEMKYNISKLKPLFYALLIEHCGRFKDSIKVVHIQGSDYLSMIPHYRLTIKNIVIYVKKSGYGSPILYKIYEEDETVIERPSGRGVSLIGFNCLSNDKEDIKLLQMIGDYQECTRQNVKAFKEARRIDEECRKRNKIINMEFDDENQ